MCVCVCVCETTTKCVNKSHVLLKGTHEVYFATNIHIFFGFG
jgi:hypothetical protein